MSKSFKGTLSLQAKDLGVSQRGIYQPNQQRKERINTLTYTAPRVNQLCSGHTSKVRVISGGLHQSVLYGCEVDYTNLVQTNEIRNLTALALWHNEGPKNRTAGLLLTNKGLIDPGAQICYRILVNWKRQMHIGQGPHTASRVIGTPRGTKGALP